MIRNQDLAAALLGARSTSAVDAVVTAAQSLYGGSGWFPLGGRPNNAGTVRLAADPLLALVERITNASDATLDLAHLMDPALKVSSPREAAQVWFGVPAGGLSDMNEKSRRALAEERQVRFSDSGDPKRPTISISDRGTGQTAARLPKTILSLNEANKVDQPHMQGTFGQGGSAACGFSERTVVITRRHPDLLDGAPDEVAWTVIEERFSTGSKSPNYVYLAAPSGEIFTLNPADFPDLPYGTTIVHVAYDWQGSHLPYTTQPWQFLHAALFDPVLPFIIEGDRTESERKQNHVVIGNATRLNNQIKSGGKIEVAHYDSYEHYLSGDFGTVKVNYWVLVRPEGVAGNNPVDSYVKADSAISLTLYGQRQGTKPRVWIKDVARLPYVYKNMIVQIDCDGLTPRARGLLFSSTRERATVGHIQDDIFRFLEETLREDEALTQLNSTLRERALAKSTAATSEKVRQLLAKHIATRLAGTARPKSSGKTGTGGSGAGSGSGGTGGTGTDGAGANPGSGGGTGSGKRQPRSVDDSLLPNIPTHLRFAKDEFTVTQGGTGSIIVEIDAKNGYLPQHAQDLSVSVEPPSVGTLRLAQRSRLLGGEMRLRFEATEDVPVGVYEIKATLLVSGVALEDEAKLRINEAQAKTRGGGGGGAEEETGPSVRWVRMDDWLDGWDGHEIGEVQASDTTTDILVNYDAEVLVKALPASLTEAQVKLRRERYLVAVACGLWDQHYDQDELAAEVRPSDDYLKRERERLATAVVRASQAEVDVEETIGAE